MELCPELPQRKSSDCGYKHISPIKRIHLWLVARGQARLCLSRKSCSASLLHVIRIDNLKWWPIHIA